MSQDTTLPAEHYGAQPGQGAAAPALLTEQVARWKQQHREVLEVRVQVAEGDEAIAYLKPADRNVIAFALTKVMSKQLLEAGEFLLRNCWLGGDERMKDGSPVADDRIIVAGAIEAAGTLDLLSSSSRKL